MAVVEPEVPGKHITKSHRQHEIGNACIAKQFEADKKGRDGAVGDTAEHGNHAHRST